MKQVKKILISQPRPQVERNPYSGMENDYGVQCDFHQLIKVEGIGVREFRDQHIYLEDYTAVLKTRGMSGKAHTNNRCCYGYKKSA